MSVLLKSCCFHQRVEGKIRQQDSLCISTVPAVISSERPLGGRSLIGCPCPRQVLGVSRQGFREPKGTRTRRFGEVRQRSWLEDGSVQEGSRQQGICRQS